MKFITRISKKYKELITIIYEQYGVLEVESEKDNIYKISVPVKNIDDIFKIEEAISSFITKKNTKKPLTIEERLAIEEEEFLKKRKR
jgi:hypothetical protein